jgi:hypothetical protein
VGDLEELLGAAGRRFEPEVKRRLGGLLGSLMKAYLPQAWVFRTDRGVATFRVDASGSTSVTSGADAHPDVTVELPYAALERALSRDGGTPSAAPPASVTPHTKKGKAAFDYLRQRLGL